MSERIIRLVLVIILLYITLFPFKKTLRKESEYDVSFKEERKNGRMPDHITYVIMEENTIIWNE
ncbi:MAG: hypothetical protein IPN97_07035 [Saprospiraceae bacterium]|nr:hypothetical protein [Saprospiraceae bacterium]MBK9042946.1 hypothetical protein [Saprospiraceae bacterium]